MQDIANRLGVSVSCWLGSDPGSTSMDEHPASTAADSAMMNREKRGIDRNHGMKKLCCHCSHIRKAAGASERGTAAASLFRISGGGT